MPKTHEMEARNNKKWIESIITGQGIFKIYVIDEIMVESRDSF
jgi:hypothetical protein